MNREELEVLALELASAVPPMPTVADLSAAQIKLNEILINVAGAADVLDGLAEKDGGKRHGPWNVYIMLNNVLNDATKEMVEVMETLRKVESAAR